MTNENPVRKLSAILCADWGKAFPKRAVYAADVATRVVRRVSATGWSLAGILEQAGQWSSAGAVLAAFDAPLGVPESYLEALSRVTSGPPSANFIELLERTQGIPFFDGTAVTAEWCVDRPFFSVPAGDGGLRSYINASARHGVTPWKEWALPCVPFNPREGTD